MSMVLEPNLNSFIDRRSHSPMGSPSRERRQFANSYEELSVDAANWPWPSTNTSRSIAAASSRMKKCWA